MSIRDDVNILKWISIVEEIFNDTRHIRMCFDIVINKINILYIKLMNN